MSTRWHFFTVARGATCRGCWIQVAAMLLLVSVGANQAAAQLCVQLNGVVYRQDFNTLPTTGTSNLSSTLPIGFAYSESGTGNNVTYAANAGNTATGNTYSYGSTGDSDRALGELDSGTFQSTLGGCFVNNTGFMITSLSIAYTGEQWRLGAADATKDKLDFQFSTTATSLNDGAIDDPKWVNVNTLDFETPNNGGATGAKDGNAAGNRKTFAPTAIIPAGGIPFGSIFFIRWVPTNISGANDGLAIDDFSLTYNAMADFDLDQDVDGKDFIMWQRGFVKKSGASITDGDANKDGAVDAVDLLLWKVMAGTTKDAPPIMAAPEPASGCLALAFGAILTVAARRR